MSTQHDNPWGGADDLKLWDTSDNQTDNPWGNDNSSEQKPWETNQSSEAKSDDFVPIMKPDEVHKGSESGNGHTVFFFGSAQSGKSVILSSLLYQMRMMGVLRPSHRANTQEAEILLTDFFEDMRRGILPRRTVRDQVTRLDLTFEPNNKSEKTPPIDLTFLETSGENHFEIHRGGKYHSSIETYLKGKTPLVVVAVTSYDTAYREDALLNSFFDKLEVYRKGMRHIKLILVISKWDKSQQLSVVDEDELDDFIKSNLPATYQRLDTYGLSRTYYTVGQVVSDGGSERIAGLTMHTAENLSNWIYESITGYPIDYEGTFWERIKWGLGL